MVSKSQQLAILFVLCAVAAQAQVALTLEAPSTVIAHQSTQSPCVIGDPSCSNPVGFDFTQIGPGLAHGSWILRPTRWGMFGRLR